MTRTIKTLAVLLLLAVLPLRGLAAVTVGFCAMGHQEPAAHAGAGHDHGAHDHEQGSAPEPASTPDCNMCVEHCGSASFAVPAPLGASLVSDRTARIASGESFAAGFVPDHLDPPPLAL